MYVIINHDMQSSYDFWRSVSASSAAAVFSHQHLAASVVESRIMSAIKRKRHTSELDAECVATLISALTRRTVRQRGDSDSKQALFTTESLAPISTLRGRRSSFTTGIFPHRCRQTKIVCAIIPAKGLSKELASRGKPEILPGQT